MTTKSDNTMRRAYVLRTETAYLSKQIEALAMILQGESYNRGFNAGFDYAATGKTEGTTLEENTFTETLAPTEHVLTSDHNGEPVCSCGYDPAQEGARYRIEAIEMVRLHRREMRAAA